MIEIEKKFLLTEDQLNALLDGARPLGQKQFEDAYLDTVDYSLSTNDLWFRQRDGVYELKVPLRSVGTNNTGTNRYHELTDEKEIASELQLTVKTNLTAALAKAAIVPFITCYTDRKSYEKDGFHIDVDAASYKDSNFTYAVAEIELLITDESQADDAEQSIIRYAQTYDLTTDKVILGKIGAFLKEEKPDHYAALVAANVLR
jgi:adenylate cyclase class IV